MVTAIGVVHPAGAAVTVIVTELVAVFDFESVTVRVAVYVPAAE
jgi:hypothetical protein